MDKLRIQGGNQINGTIAISGAKNAALPLMACSILSQHPLHLSNIPDLADITSTIHLLENLGVTCTYANSSSSALPPLRSLCLNAGSLLSSTAPYELVRKMRASILVLGPLLARTGEAVISLPGGCAIGMRPVDLHIKGLEAMGATIYLDNGYIHASAPQGLQGADYTFPIVSVTGTENLLMAATLAKGRTRLLNAACEPEVSDVAHCLQAMGAHIEGIGTNTLTIQGVDALSGATHSIIPDRIETGTYAVAAAITKGRVILTHTQFDFLMSFFSHLKDIGVRVEEIPEGILIDATNATLRGTHITTTHYPGFPTDLQAQVMALLCVSEGTSVITETIFENRFMHVSELIRMGAHIIPQGSTCTIEGVSQLHGAEVMATDLRASVALVLGALCAEGTSTINRIYHLDRGYERLEEKLRACGAVIERIS